MNLLNSIVAETPETIWMPRGASTVAADVDIIYYFILYLSGFFFVGIVGAMIYFMMKYSRKAEGQRTSPVKDHHQLEIWWSILPSILLVVMFVWGFKVWMNLSVPPDNAMEVRVYASQWKWSFGYPKDGLLGEPELVVPEDTPVKLIMTSADVLHSFFVPEFRIKKDVVPGRYQVVWFEATDPGVYNVFCTEYCGKDHSRMITRVVVKTKEDYAAWIRKGGSIEWPDKKDQQYGQKLADVGKVFFNRFGCNQCHSVTGEQNTGPALNGVFGSKEQCTNGQEVLVDEQYVKESILYPNKLIVKGFAPKMPSFKGKIEVTAKDRPSQMDAIIEYLKSIGK